MAAIHLLSSQHASNASTIIIWLGLAAIVTEMFPSLMAIIIAFLLFPLLNNVPMTHLLYKVSLGLSLRSSEGKSRTSSRYATGYH